MIAVVLVLPDGAGDGIAVGPGVGLPNTGAAVGDANDNSIV